MNKEAESWASRPMNTIRANSATGRGIRIGSGDWWEIVIGDIFKDLDERVTNRYLRVVGIEGPRAVLECVGNEEMITRIQMRRLANSRLFALDTERSAERTMVCPVGNCLQPEIEWFRHSWAFTPDGKRIITIHELSCGHRIVRGSSPFRPVTWETTDEED